MTGTTSSDKLTPPSEPNRKAPATRSEEHTSELQSRSDLVCRLLLEKKKKNRDNPKRREEHTTKYYELHDIVSQLTKSMYEDKNVGGTRHQEIITLVIASMCRIYLT